MKLVTWNIRGLSKVYKQYKIKVSLSENNIIAILENRVKENKAIKIIAKVSHNWDWHANYAQTC